MNVYEKIISLGKLGIDSALVTLTEVEGSVPRQAGAKLLVQADGTITGTVGGGTLEKHLVKEAQTAINNDKCKSVRLDLDHDLAMACGGVITAFIEPILSQQRLIIFGAGHIGKVLTHLGKMLEFNVTVVDNRPEFACKEMLPEADMIISGSYPENFLHLIFNDKTFIVIVTHQHLYDQQVLEFCIEQPFHYLGMIGSREKVKNSLQSLKDKGIDANMIKKIHSPIGLDIGAESPEEIALAIMAEIIMISRGRTSNFSMKLT
jgi:xanthine dehydrogenase accessory factor